ncbi:MAG: hypothetical protein RL385_4923 [Pseudomonadota bacterium]
MTATICVDVACADQKCQRSASGPPLSAPCKLADLSADCSRTTRRLPRSLTRDAANASVRIVQIQNSSGHPS